MIIKLRDNSEMRLIGCGLTTLKTRRLKVDQTEVFKIWNRYDDIDRNMFSQLRKREGLRTWSYISKNHYRLNIRKFSFHKEQYVIGTDYQLIV